jgi:ubiquinone/menaquinone biosynthesis C-methylase UbiE
MDTNEDHATVAGFGDEWARFDQSGAEATELQRHFDSYFAVFPWQDLPERSRGIDVGCGSGRWARLCAGRVGWLECVDASEQALAVARRNLSDRANVSFTHASVGKLPFENSHFDFGYSLGVLHHVPDTLAGLRECVRVLKPGAPFLLYLYYALDNRPTWYQALWKASNAVRQVVSRLPQALRHTVADATAAGIYWPLARAALLGERLGLDVSSVPLAAYRRNTFYIMRNDALDRLGTPLEQRFSRREIQVMMEAAGLTGIRFHDGVPFWCAIGYKSADPR